MKNLSLKQLSAFVAVAQEGGITVAASRIGLTPSATTTRIKELEGAVGTPVFDRTQRGMQLNEAGVIVMRMATHISSAVDMAQSALGDLQGLLTGRLSVGITSTAKYFAPHVIAAFARKHPGVEVSLTVGNRQQIISHLQQMDIDLAITGRPPSDQFVRAEPFGDHPLVVVAPPDHRLVGREKIGVEDLRNEPFLMREEGSGTRLVFEEMFRGTAPRRSNVSIEIGSNETIKQGVMAGLGLALISAHTTAFEIETGRLVVLPVDGTPIWRKWFITHRVDKTEMPAMRAFRHFVREDGAAHLPPLHAVPSKMG
jgi:DNA-binding transcriptional LysR family regulator